MANFNKKWGTVIGCWCVALVMIITGVCLALTIPSSAAGERVVKVTFDGQDSYYATLLDAFDYVNTLPTTDTNRAVVQMQQDIYFEHVTKKTEHGSSTDYWAFLLLGEKHAVWDLNGHLFTVAEDEQLPVYFGVVGTLTVIDSQPMVEHTLSNGEVVKGGTIYNPRSEFDFAVLLMTENSSVPDLTIDGGNYYGLGMISQLFAPEIKITINGGNISWNEEGFAIQVYGNGNTKMNVNGGYIGGDIRVIDIENNQPITDETERAKYIELGENVEKVTTEDGKTIYRTKVASLPENPDVPAASEQPANNNANLIGLIILAAAAVVMVAGVITIIIVNSKRNKKAA